MRAIEKLINKEKKNKTVILYPKNEYEKFIDEKIRSLKLKNYKIFKYNSDPRVLTGEIEKLTNYNQRKNNLPPMTFESNEDSMDGFDFSEFNPR